MKLNQYMIRGFVMAIASLSTVKVQAHQEENLDAASTYIEVETLENKNGKRKRKYIRGRKRLRNGPPRVGEIYADDIQRIQNRIKSKKFWTFGFGPSGGLKTDDTVYGVSVGRHWETGHQGDIRLSIDGAFGDSAGLTTATLGAGYFFSTEDTSPYLAGGLGVGIANPKTGSTERGFAGKASVGVRFFRTAETQLDLALNYNTIFGGPNPGAYGVSIQLLF